MSRLFTCQLRQPGRGLRQPWLHLAWVCMWVWLGVWVSAWAGAAVASATPATPVEEGPEAAVKAGYLVRFVGYVEWPPAARPAPGEPWVIGVAGSDAVLAELAPLVAGRLIEDRPLAARRLQPGDPLDGVHVLLIGHGLAPAQTPLPQAGRPMLVVTESATGPPEGSALNFVMVTQRVRFEAMPQAAERAGLKLSARLLAVAERVVASP